MASYEEMVAALRETLRGGRSGTFYITTSDNHSGLFGIDKGKIVSISFKRLQGVEALPALRTIKEVRTRFSPLATGAMAGIAVPPTDEIIDFLSLPDAGSAPAAPTGRPPPAARPPSPPARPQTTPKPPPSSAPRTPNPAEAKSVAPRAAAPRGVAQRLPVEQVKKVIIEEATEYLGPMASLVCNEHFAVIPPLSPASLLRVVDVIAAEVEDRHRDQFRMRVLRQVEVLLG